ncbi:MAG: ABC transporter substrate-binding protein [Chloroflexi bacterium]|nr:ABC transporter substrate-binding protein [Chloroflexota bacterium]
MNHAPRRRSRIARAVLSTIMIGSLVAAPAAAQTATPVAGGTLTFGRVASTSSLDLHSQITANNAFVIDKLFEPLLSFDAEGAIVPWLAESYTASDDGLQYTFALRDGVKFSDGTDLTANDVVFSLNRHLEVVGPIPLTAPIADIVATDESTVSITLTSPYTPFIAEMSQFSNGIIPADFGGRTEEEFFLDPVGTGPFSIGEWDPAGDLTLVKNEHYWQEGKPYLDAVVYKLISDDTQLLQQLQSGQVHAIDALNPANVADAQANASVTVLVSSGWAIEQLFLNTLDEHFSDVNVRRAVALALDREGITAATTFGTAQVANSLIPPTIEYSANDAGIALPYDVEAAKQELAKSAFPDGFSATLLLASGNAQRAQEAQIVQAALAEIGITVEIESIDIAAFRARFFALDYDFMINSGLSDQPDPNGLITFQADPTGFSKSYWTSYTNPEVTALMEQGRVTPDGNAREQIYLDIQTILANDAPYIPLFYPSNIKASSSTTHGLVVLPNGSVRFEDAWIESAE